MYLPHFKNLAPSSRRGLLRTTRPMTIVRRNDVSSLYPTVVRMQWRNDETAVGDGNAISSGGGGLENLIRSGNRDVTSSLRCRPQSHTAYDIERFPYCHRFDSVHSLRLLPVYRFSFAESRAGSGAASRLPTVALSSRESVNVFKLLTYCVISAFRPIFFSFSGIIIY